MSLLALNRSIFKTVRSSLKLLCLFLVVYDLDGDGLIQHEELQHVMRACMDENGMKFSDTQVGFEFFS